MASKGNRQQHVAHGKALAKKVLSARSRTKRKYAAHKTRVMQERALGAAPASRPVLVAEGDSWFDYPMWDVLKMLEDKHGYDVQSVAHWGDRVESMAYDLGQLDGLLRAIEKVIERGQGIKAILLSGGGNDLAGEQFEVIINHKRSGLPPVNAEVLSGVIDGRIVPAYHAIIAAVQELTQTKVGKALPILVHGYSYPVPDGRGFLGGFGPLPGPWLEPGFALKGYGDIKERTRIMVPIMDALNDAVSRVASATAGVTYVDVRSTLSNGAKYKDSWGNELHPTEKGFAAVADRFAQALQGT